MNWKKLIIVIVLVVFSLVLPAQNHPRILCHSSDKEAYQTEFAKVEWKQNLIQEKINHVEKYIDLCASDPQWLVSRLQMYWKYKYTDIYTKGGKYSHGEGEAPIPTVRFSGTRDWATDYLLPDLEQVIPYDDSAEGIYLQHKDSKEWTYVPPNLTGHIIEGINRKIMAIAKDAAFLYWWTGAEKYAELATPIFETYIKGMYYRNPPQDILNTNQQRLSGLATFEVIHEQIVKELALTFDFLHPYLQQQDFDFDKVGAVFQKWGDQIIKNGVADNNWNFFQARYLMYIALVLESNDRYANGKGQAYYLKYTLDVSSERQTAFADALLEYDPETGFWFESASYSLHVTTTLLEILSLLDNVSNQFDSDYFKIVERASQMSFQYLFPTGYTIGFGDSKHGIIPPKVFELLYSMYTKYQQKEKAEWAASHLQGYIDKGQYQRKGGTLFELFTYENTIESRGVKQDGAQTDLGLWSTVYAPNVSLFIQRLGQGKDAMMVATSGSYGNHAHSNGISMELFANNYVLGPDMGRGTSYWHSDHQDYYSQFPAHNTVVVDGISQTDKMEGHHPFTLDQYYPETGPKFPEFRKISYVNVSFVEPKTQAKQKRFTAQVLTESGQGYIIDVFRSRKVVDGPQNHSYFYHNIGHDLQFFNSKGEKLTLDSTDELNSSSGHLKAYDFLTHQQKTIYSDPLQAEFLIEKEGRSTQKMKVWINGSENQEIFSVLSPPSRATVEGTAPKSLVDQPIPTMILRRNQAAWSQPFALVYNPFIGKENPVKEVEFSAISAFPLTQKLKVSQRDSIFVDEWWINSSINDLVKEKDFYLKGLLTMIRMKASQPSPYTIFLSGVYQWKYKQWEILAKGKPVTISMASTPEGYQMQNDEAVVLYIPMSEDKPINTMTVFQNGKKVKTRKGYESRVNPGTIEFRLSQAYDKVLFYYTD